MKYYRSEGITIDKLIEKAKNKVIQAYEHKENTQRKWLTAYVDSYSDKDYRIEILVLEGSPAKGVVLINYGRNFVLAIDAWGKVTKYELIG